MLTTGDIFFEHCDIHAAKINSRTIDRNKLAHETDKQLVETFVPMRKIAREVLPSVVGAIDPLGLHAQDVLHIVHQHRLYSP